MLRTLFRAAVIVVILIAAVAFFAGYRWTGGSVDVDPPAVGTTGDVDTSDARETGARIGEAVATGASRAQQVASEASLTAKIKAKMTLDDTIEAARIDVDTTGSVVTVSGRVRSEAERQRVLQLARETEGVTRVNDSLEVRQ
jgi:osmotically-inducible protein OsmY